MNRVYNAVQLEMGKKLFNKKYNLSGGMADTGGFDLYPKIVSAFFEPNAGPIAKINLSAINVTTEGKQCRLDLKRVNGLTYKLHVGGAIGFTLLVFLIAGFWAVSDFQDFDPKIFLLLFFGFFYFLLIESVADITTSNTKKRILKILSDSKIKYKKQESAE